MDYPKRKHPRLKQYDYSQAGLYFITICTKNRAPLLGTIVANYIPEESHLGMEQICLSAIGACCKARLEDIPNYYRHTAIDCYIIMPDHIHLLLEIDETSSGGQRSGRPTVQQILHAFKRLTTQEANQVLWQDSFYEHIVRSEAELAEIRTYILGNPWKRITNTSL